MNIHIVKNTFLNTLLILMLISAIIHVVVLVFLFIISRDINLLNYFIIVGINDLFPGVFNTATSSIASFIFVVALYGFILKFNKSA